jgi:hypothetical protein
MVYSRAERVFSLEHYVASQSYAVREAFSSATGNKISSGCLSSRRWTFSASAVKLFFKFFLKNNNQKAIRLSCLSM